MISETTQEALTKGNQLLEELEHWHKFGSVHVVRPISVGERLVEEMKSLSGVIPDYQTPEDLDKLFQSELKRRMGGEASLLEQQLRMGFYKFQTILNIYGIPSEDVEHLESWLQKHKPEAIEAMSRLYAMGNVTEFNRGLAMDIPSIKRQAEEVANLAARKYHKVIGKYLQNTTSVGEFLREMECVVTTEHRSYFHTHANYLALGITAFCTSSSVDGSPVIREKELIRLYGHEGMGHALNKAMTIKSDLPGILKRDSALTVATDESVAQFYERALIDVIHGSHDLQRELDIAHKFEEIYQDIRAAELLEEHLRIENMYGICVLADTSFGNPIDSNVVRARAEKIAQFALDPGKALRWVDSHKYNYDSEGNFSADMISELRYCARPVDRALDEFRKLGINYDEGGRKIIDPVLLTGFWTPQGYVDNARIRAQEHIK